MRILFLTCHLPYPPISGGRLREYELLRRLSGEFEVHLCAVSKTHEEDVRGAAALRGFVASTRVFPASSKPVNGHAPAQVLRHASAAARCYVRDAGSRVDVVHVEGFYLMQHVPNLRTAPVLLVEQNVEYLLCGQRMALAEENRRHAFLQYRLTREHELAAWRGATMCATVTEDERTIVARAIPGPDVRVLPDGADHLRPRAVAREPDERTLLFVANFGYEPNVDAAVHLCREILPRIPNARLFLVGNAPPEDVLALASDRVCVTGRVPEVEPYLDRAAVVVCPLRIGGGVKVKVLEALCRGKAVVTTSIGVQGLGAQAHAAARVADEPAAFAAAVGRLLDRPDERRQLERRAGKFASTLPTWNDSVQMLESCYRELGALRAAAPLSAPQSAS
jgi:polysaccharide biosynthesis protein PslH